MKWKLVPNEPTPEMLEGMEEMHMPFGEMLAAWDDAMEAAPNPLDDAELVERVAVAICNDQYSADVWDELPENDTLHVCKALYWRHAQAAIATMNGGE